jgi:hypothetical protein
VIDQLALGCLNPKYVKSASEVATALSNMAGVGLSDGTVGMFVWTTIEDRIISLEKHQLKHIKIILVLSCNQHWLHHLIVELKNPETTNNAPEPARCIGCGISSIVKTDIRPPAKIQAVSNYFIREK